MPVLPTPSAEPSARRGADAKLCLDFVNTVAWRNSGKPEERLPSAEALVEWCAKAGVLDAAGAAAAARNLSGSPDKASAVHLTALTFREAAYGLFRARVDGRPAPPADVQALNAVIALMPQRLALVPDRDGLGWRDATRPATALDILAPLVWSAADLLSGPRAERVKQCEDPKGCGWLFVDDSRTGTRRWCSMGDCGNRAKARRHYHRARDEEVAGGGRAARTEKPAGTKRAAR
ncbi:CGNR zinc finger domain-containing protein [Phreatobacter stygius]|uniref:Zinc finger CGNR domain-containing protein n=1 Tax=Phreatobacter stygius TaxID=1940610 RepID=A0A4D7APJ6_9HYPH|nr:ABATE domain-containing protein [Phreatobacter stygius]QCI63114.1 hypothetical protein E8M01_02000 [Phreatobacter stygius]